MFWAIEGKLAGRPGPNRAPWDPPALFDAGFRAVLSVNRGIGVSPEALSAAGLAHLQLRFPTGIPPHPDALDVALEALPQAYRFYTEHRDRGAVLVHCSFGKDRTGLFLAHAMMREQGLSAEQALAKLKRVRPIALTADGWEDLAREALPRAIGG